MAKVAVASDHAGFQLKGLVCAWAQELGHDVVDHGPAAAERCDYPDYAAKVAGAVASRDAEFGILVCGSGIGMAMAANRVAGVRAANCTHVWQAEMTRRHNDANVLCLGERIVGPGIAEEIVKAFFANQFEGGRHQDRVRKIDG